MKYVVFLVFRTWLTLEFGFLGPLDLHELVVVVGVVFDRIFEFPGQLPPCVRTWEKKENEEKSSHFDSSRYSIFDDD